MGTSIETKLTERFVDFMRTLELSPGLFAPNVFCDMNVPMWRFQLEGGEALAAWAKSEQLQRSTVTPGRVREQDGSAVVETEIVTGSTYSRNVWLLHADADGLIDEVVLYCTGPWDPDTVERQRREAPMLRP